MLRFLPLLAIVLVASSAGAVDITSTGFLVRHELAVGAPPAKVYDALLGQVGSWWNEQHTYSGDARNLSIDARPGGCFCERLSNGGVEHMRVVQLRQNQLLRMAGGLGPLQGAGLAGAMTWSIAANEGGTKLELIYVVGGYMPGGFEKMAPAVEGVLLEQATRLKRFVETGSAAPAK